MVYKIQKSLDVTTIGGHRFLQAGPEAVAGLGNGVPVLVDCGIPDGCPEVLLVVVGPAVHLTLQNTPHKTVERITVWR